MSLEAEEKAIRLPSDWTETSEKPLSVPSVYARDGAHHAVSPQLSLTIITQFFPPDFAPTGQLISELAVQLAKLGMQVHLFTSQPSYAYDQDRAPARQQLLENAPGSVNLRRTRAARLYPHRIRGKAINGLLFFVRAALHLLRHRPTSGKLLLTSAPPYLPILGWLLHRLGGPAYTVLIYDLYPDVAVQLNVVDRRHPLVRIWDWLNRQVWRQAEHVIVLNTAMRERLLARCPECADRITTIHNWADPEFIRPLPKQANWFARTHQLEREFTVLYSGNMGRCHDLETILEAMALLADQPIRFVFIGDGAQGKRVRQALEQCRSGQCLWLPYQRRAVLPYSLTCGDLSLVSLVAGVEGAVAPSKLYSLLAAGRPIAAICEPGSYLRELLRLGGCGDAFANGDGAGLAAYIQQLSENPQQTQRLGQAARAYLLEHFTPERCARQYFRVLQNQLSPD